MVIIETEDEFQGLLGCIRTDDFILDLVLTDSRKHPCNNDVSLLFFRVLESGLDWCLPLMHNECSTNFDCLTKWFQQLVESMKMSIARKFVLDKKTCVESFGEDIQFLDLNVWCYLETGKPVDFSDLTVPAKIFVESNFKTLSSLNQAIPIYKHASIFYKRLAQMNLVNLPTIDRSFEFINDVAIPRFAQLENIGLSVDEEEFIKIYGEEQRTNVKNGLVFSQYHLYTSTGRPSNRFGGVNYAAINKSDGSRKPFVSRFGNEGLLVMVDYSAFHPRLIASLARYDMPFNVNPYQYLAKFFYNTSNPTPPQVAASKGECFHQMYGGIQDRNLHIPYFRATQTYIDHRWNFFVQNEYVETPIYHRKIKLCHIDDPTPNKLFNYILQAYETEVAVQTLGRILDFLQGRLTKPVLYTYDSLLFDTHRSDGKKTLQQLKKIMVDEKFPVKVYVGKNYDEMVQINVE